MEHLLETQMTLPLPVEEVFPFFADAANLQRITPPELDFRILSPLPIEMRVGARIEYRMSLFHVPFRWRTEITRWDENQCFVDEQKSGPYRLWVHTHHFRSVSGGTEIFDQVRYELPLTPVGDIVHPWVRRQLDHIFRHRERETRAAFA